MTGTAFALPPIDEIVERLNGGPGNKLDALLELMTSPEGKAWQKEIQRSEAFQHVAEIGSESYRDSIMTTIHALVAGYATGLAIAEARREKKAA